MTTTAWPYAVTRGENSGYQAIVAPGFLADAGQAYVLEYASKQETDDPATVTVRDVLGAVAGPLSLAYRVSEARADHYGIAGSAVLEDTAGRAIRVFEGLVLRLSADKVPSIGLTAADFDAVTGATVPAFRKLWLAGTPIDAELSTAIGVGGAAPGQRPLRLRVAEPYLVPGSDREPARTVARGSVREDRQPPSFPRSPGDPTAGQRRPSRNRLVTSVVVVGLLLALLAWYLTRPSGPAATQAAVTTTQAAVSQTCADLKNGDVDDIYQEFSSAYQHSTDLAAFGSRLLGSSHSATCTATSIRGDRAVLSLRLASGVARTVDMDFQSETGQVRATAVTVKS